MRYRLNKEDGIKILKGLGIAMGGAGLTYLSETIIQIDFGSYTPLIVGMFSVLVNFLRKFIPE